MATPKQLTQTLNLIVHIVRCIGLKRALEAADNNPKLNFWRLTQGNLLDSAVLDWCKLFGSHNKDNQQVHWKNIFPQHHEFFQYLLSYVEITESEWVAYRCSMKKYRDQHVAHLDFKDHLNKSV